MKFCGKPKNKEDAIRMLKKLQGKRHTVYTSLSVIIEERGEVKEYKEVNENYVYVKKMDISEILNYVDTRYSSTVKELSELTGSSESTVRRDIQSLVEAGKLNKIYGGVKSIKRKVITEEPEMVKNII